MIFTHEHFLQAQKSLGNEDKMKPDVAGIATIKCTEAHIIFNYVQGLVSRCPQMIWTQLFLLAR
jgi:hypothetical protein